MNQEDIKRIVKTRQLYNRKILGIISALVEEYPELRFCQIMASLGYELKNDRFYEEPYLTFRNIKRNYTDMIIRNTRKDDKKD